MFVKWSLNLAQTVQSFYNKCVMKLYTVSFVLDAFPAFT